MHLRERLRAREPLVGSWVSLADPAVAEMVASLGYDFVLVDMEHTPATLETVEGMARAVDAADGDVPALVRVPGNGHVAIKRVLDLGVRGVMVPMVESAQEARDLVAATRYPPAGVRGVGGGRAADYGLSMEGYVDTADERIVTIAQVETEAGLENVEAIAGVDGLDALFIGPADLSTALGAFGEYDAEAFVAAVDRILGAGRDAGIPVATLSASADGIERWIDWGFDFLMAGADVGHVLAGAARTKGAAERAFADRESPDGSS